MTIGVFDSGIGGEAIAESIGDAIPEARIIVVNDKAHLPYGLRNQDEIIALTDAAIQPLLSADCDVIVLACNTATAAAITTLRERYPEQRFIGLEPMIKTAAERTTAGVVCICATPSTLASSRYHRLKQMFAADITVIEPDCSDWASLIEDGTVEEQHIHEQIDSACDAGADVIVLACTHYHWIREEIEKVAAGRAQVINPSEAIVRRVKALVTSQIG